jgi:hypothetical protein
MSTLAKLLIVPALVVAFSVGVALAASGVGGGSSTPEAQVAPGTSTNDTTTLDTTTIGTTTTEFEDRDDDFREPGEDLRGPCDEAEHAFDPRCTGVGDDRDDNAGPGIAHEDRDDNSGPGNAHDDNDDDDDRSGHGGGDDDDDSSGHGGGEDD